MTRPLASYLAPYIADGGPLPSTVTVNAADLLAAVGELRRMRELCQRAFYEMLNLGNDLNWPHEIPMSYGEIMNELKAAALAPADGATGACPHRYVYPSTNRCRECGEVVE
jgi:hypothetical protein